MSKEGEVKGFASTEEIDAKLASLDALTSDYNNMDKQLKGKQTQKDVKSFLIILKATPVDKKAGLTNSRLQFCKGKALAMLPDSFKESQQSLQKAIKLEPKMVEAWNCLGNCYWRNGDLKNAKNCFSSAIDHRPNAASFRDLSMILRSLRVEPGSEERADNITHSIARARDAIALDVKDSESWYVMGNAYLTKFIETSDHAILNKALKAYQMAETCQGDKHPNPDLYFNRANVFKFHEDYASAVENYKKAYELDPTLPAQDEINNIMHLATKLAKLTSSKPNKRVVSLLDSLPDPKEWRDARDLVTVEGLSPGSNKGKAVVMKMVAPVNKPTDIPVSVVGIDGSHKKAVVSLYNVVSNVLNRFKVGDTLCLFDPELKEVSVGGASYTVLQMTKPEAFLVNGKRLHSEQHASAQAISQCK